jgi:hypothetical protein
MSIRRRGAGESSTDLAWDGHVDIHEMGALLAESPRFSTGPVMAMADIDVDRIRQERMRVVSFGDATALNPPKTPFRIVPFDFTPPAGDLALARTVERFPFTPSDPAKLRENCYEAYNIQVQGLARRVEATGSKSLVIGISGGLDSTHALIVACQGHGPAGPTALGHPRLHLAGLRHLRPHQVQRLGADAGDRRDRRGDRHPPGRPADAGRPGPPVRQGRAGL